MRKANFRAGGIRRVGGYIADGMAQPLFDKEGADKIVDLYNDLLGKPKDTYMTYDADRDEYVVRYDATDFVYGVEYHLVGDEVVPMYRIGAPRAGIKDEYEWFWEEVT